MSEKIPVYSTESSMEFFQKIPRHIPKVETAETATGRTLNRKRGRANPNGSPLDEKSRRLLPKHYTQSFWEDVRGV